MSTIRIDPADLDSVSRSINGCAEQLMTGLQQLETTVTSRNPWGSDEPGTVFGMAYTALLGHALETLASHVQQLADAAQGLATWSSTTQRADSDTTMALQAINTSLDG